MATPQLTLHRSKSLEPSQQVSAGQHLDIDRKILTDSGPRYRRLLYLAVPVHAQANGLHLEGPRLGGRFQPVQLASGRHSDHLAEPWREEDGKVIARFKRPWHIARINTAASGYIDCYRVDGDAIADESSADGFRGETLDPEFVSGHFALQFKPASKAPPRGKFKEEREARRDTPKGKSVGAMVVDVDADPMARAPLLQGGAELMDVSFHNISSIVLNSYPTTPGISLPADLTQAPALSIDDADTPLRPLWSEAGEKRNGSDFSLSDTLVNALIAGLETHYESLSRDEEIIWIPLVLESDCPCRWQLDDLHLPFHYVVNRFADQAREITLAFTADTPTRQSLPLPIPSGDINHLRLTVDIANRQRLLNGRDANTDQCHRGYRLDEQHLLATKVTPDGAGFYGAVRLFASLASDEIDITASLIPEAMSPTGQPLVTGRATLQRQGARQWLQLSFPQQRLDAQSYWLVIQCHRGQLVWLGTDNPDARVAQLPAAQRADSRTFNGLAPLAELLASDNSNEDQPALFTLATDKGPLPYHREGLNITLENTDNLAGAKELMVEQVANGKLTFRDPEIRFFSTEF